MIIYDAAKCRDCGTCLTIRGGYCLTRDGSEVRIDRTVCNECGECMARCPSQAFSFQGFELRRLDRGAQARPGAIEELLHAIDRRLFTNGMDVTKRKMEHSWSGGGILYAESLGLATCLMDSVKIGVNATPSISLPVRFAGAHDWRD